MLVAAPAAAQTGARDTVVVAGARYEASAFHRFLLGAHYRDAWTRPMRVPILDLSRFAGGLTPVEKGGGMQTVSLRFQGADGREYTFRSVDKNPGSILPEELRETLVADIIQDQISAGHPVGALAVPPILEAVGVLHAEPQLMVMPDDPRLGEFRAEFAGMLGLIEVRPEEGTDTLPGFAGASNVVGTERLLERLEERGERVDARRFLAARLVDVYLGDWDRHRDQWRWARFGNGRDDLWVPIPRDRDQAFVKFDGILLTLARQYHPQLVEFEEDYPAPLGLTWNGRELDRRLLVELEWPVWDSIARTLQSQIADEVIDRAVGALPRELQEAGGDELRSALRVRRDLLADFAREFYLLLAGEVDVNMTDSAEIARVRRAGSELTVEIARRSAPGQPVFRRTFRRDETNDVRLFLHGGNDSTVINGTGAITVRVIGGGDDDVFIDATPGGSDRFYDAEGDNTFVRAGGTHVDERAWVYPEEYAPSQPPRDWGSLYRYPLWMLIEPDVGLLAGAGIERTRYGFRQYPYASKVRVRAAAGTGPRKIRAELDAVFHREASRTHWLFSARASGLDVLRFHGFGNETELTEGDDFYLVDQMAFSLDARFVMPLGARGTLAAGPSIRLTETDVDQGRLIGLLRPYGTRTFGQAGVKLEAEVDTRDRVRAASRGVRLEAGASLYPAFWDVGETFGDVYGEVSTFLTAPIGLQPTLALRAGGRRVMGDYPFSEAAYIGDDETIRLGRKQRYAGDGEAHLNAELRMKLFRAQFVLPADFGVFGLADAGRVFLRGEDSDKWHTAVGGGIWLAFLQPINTVSLAVARSAERTGVYVGAGFAF